MEAIGYIPVCGCVGACVRMRALFDLRKQFLSETDMAKTTERTVRQKWGGGVKLSISWQCTLKEKIPQ